MKRQLFRMVVSTLLTFTAFMLPSCDTKDDELWDRVDELFERVEKLEDACTQMNTDIHSIQSVLSAIQNNYSITSVTPLDDEEGYTITFSNGEKITINHGKNGADGKDGNTPTISIKDMGNGQYAWLVNGELLRDAQGNPIPVNGKDGQDGEDGKDGADGEDGKDGYNGSSAPTPIVKTGSELISSGINGSWDREAVYISVNGGSSWTQISSSNGGSIFASVNTSNVGYITFTLTNGIKFTVPRTDDLASLILGEWKYGQYYTFQFNVDGTYIKIDTYNNTIEMGTYEVLPNQYNMILYTNETNEDFIHIVSIDEYLMRWEDYDSQVMYLYRPNAFIFDKTEINAPQEGGKFTIPVDAKFPFQVSDVHPNYENSNNSTNIYSSTNANTTLSFTPSVTENSIVVEVEPNMSNLNLSAEFYIEDTRGNRLKTITINQDKNTEVALGEVELSEWGKNIVTSIYYSVGNFSAELTNMGWDYTSGGNPNFKPRLSSDNGTLSYVWSDTYRAINEINRTLRLAEQELPNGPLKAPLETLRAILYYNLAVCWGNINYVTEVDLNNIYSTKQLTTTQLFEKIIPQLKNAIDVLEERIAPNRNEDDAIFLSKDVVRMALAQIYMCLGDYSKAESLLLKIKDNDFYDFYKRIYYNGISMYSYTDLLLSLAECKLNSKTPDDANTFINEIMNHNQYQLSIESTDKKQVMKEIRYELDMRYDYFAFLKRNELAKETIGITEDYQLLFPIPQSELNLNPNMIQNPGY